MSWFGNSQCMDTFSVCTFAFFYTEVTIGFRLLSFVERWVGGMVGYFVSKSILLSVVVAFCTIDALFSLPLDYVCSLFMRRPCTFWLSCILLWGYLHYSSLLTIRRSANSPFVHDECRAEDHPAAFDKVWREEFEACTFQTYLHFDFSLRLRLRGLGLVIAAAFSILLANWGVVYV